MVEPGGKSHRVQDRRVVRTKRAIREAFAKLAQEYDYEKITIAALSREADIDRKTFYLHYRSVDDVVDELMHEEVERVVGILREGLSLDGERVDVTDLFTKLSMGLVQNLTQSRRVMEHLSVDSILKKVERPLTDALIEEDAFGLANVEPVYLEYCVSFFVTGLLSMYRRWLLSDSEIPLEELSDVASVVVFSGVDGLLQSAANAPTH